MTRTRRLFASGIVAAILLGCASEPRGERTLLAGNAARTLLILPLNVTAVMPPELEGFGPAVWDELASYLEDQGKQLKTVNFRDARQLWLGSIRKVRDGEKGAEAGFDDAARAFVLELGRDADFDAVIVPSLFVREAIVSGSSARWDGVTRPVELEFSGPADPKSAEEVALEGLAPAASLHVVVLDAQGKRLQESLRGLELLVKVRVRGRGSRWVSEPQAEAPMDPAADPHFEYARRSDPFEERQRVRESIGEALAPFLPPLPRGVD